MPPRLVQACTPGTIRPVLVQQRRHHRRQRHPWGAGARSVAPRRRVNLVAPTSHLPRGGAADARRGCGPSSTSPPLWREGTADASHYGASNNPGTDRVHQVAGKGDGHAWHPWSCQSRRPHGETTIFDQMSRQHITSCSRRSRWAASCRPAAGPGTIVAGLGLLVLHRRGVRHPLRAGGPPTTLMRPQGQPSASAASQPFAERRPRARWPLSRQPGASRRCRAMSGAQPGAAAAGRIDAPATIIASCSTGISGDITGELDDGLGLVVARQLGADRVGVAGSAREPSARRCRSSRG